jgi:hypothetical protein
MPIPYQDSSPLLGSYGKPFSATELPLYASTMFATLADW